MRVLCARVRFHGPVPLKIETNLLFGAHSVAKNALEWPTRPMLVSKSVVVLPPPPLVYENNGVAATTASKSLSNKGL